MIALRMEVRGANETRAELTDIERSQLPFATARALTKTVQQAQSFVRGDLLPAHFTLRRPTWAKQGVRITPATKQKLEASVQDINPYMGLQQTGGEKIPYGNYLAVPLSGARPTPRSLVSADNLPHAVMERGGFIRGNVMYAVAFKAGRRGRVSRAIGGIQKAANWERKVVPMYALVKRAVLRPRYEFVEKVSEAAQAHFDVNFAESFQQAVRTAKR